MKIYAPVKDATGTWCSVRFINGVGETDNPSLINWFKSHGYKVQDEQRADVGKKVDESNVVNEDKIADNNVDFESMTPNELRDWMRENGYGTKIKNTRSKEKLLAILKEG